MPSGTPTDRIWENTEAIASRRSLYFGEAFRL
jgi:hypothetical protein